MENSDDTLDALKVRIADFIMKHKGQFKLHLPDARVVVAQYIHSDGKHDIYAPDYEVYVAELGFFVYKLLSKRRPFILCTGTDDMVATIRYAFIEERIVFPNEDIDSFPVFDL